MLEMCTRRRLPLHQHPQAWSNPEWLCQEGRLTEAIRSIYQSVNEGFQISRKTLFLLLEGCIRRNDLISGREVKSLISKCGFESNTFLNSHLVRMFASCGSLSEADSVFKKLSNPNVYSWNAVISAHAKLGNSAHALDLYQNLELSDIKANEYIYVSVLKACTNLIDLIPGNLIFSRIIEDGFELNLFIGNTLIDMYTKCGCLKEAHKVFTDMQKKDTVSWNTLIAGYAQFSCVNEAIRGLHEMQQRHLVPDDVTFTSLLKACSNMHDLYNGELLHHTIVDYGILGKLHVTNILIHMYMTCGSVDDAVWIFKKLTKRDIVTWSTTISGYAHHGYAEKAIDTFKEMQIDGLMPNKVTFPSILKACAGASTLAVGKVFHSHIVESDHGSDAYVGSALIDMYAKCGSFKDALGVFNTLLGPHEVTWNAMIGVYAQNDHGHEALELFKQLYQFDFQPDRATFLSALRSCSSLAALDWGKLLHDQIIKSGLAEELSVANALIDMYSKCGSVVDASAIFEKMSIRSVITWSAMLAGYSLHNEYELVIDCFEEMQIVGLKPNDVTFLSLLSACCHKGLVDKGYNYFYSMNDCYGVKPATEHYNCMVDLLGRAGCINEAAQLLHTMPYEDKFLGWKSILTHCRKYNNVVFGRQCFEHLIAIDPRDASIYALMLDIYSNVNMWEEVYQIQEMRKKARVQKKVGKAFMHIGDTIHRFTAGNTEHPKMNSINLKLKEIFTRMKESSTTGFPESIFSSLMLDNEDDVLCGHCERFAICFGLLSTPNGNILRVSKNLKMCDTCHSLIKFISKFENRDIIINDTYRIHHFKYGCCSCNDYY